MGKMQKKVRNKHMKGRTSSISKNEISENGDCGCETPEEVLVVLEHKKRPEIEIASCSMNTPIKTSSDSSQVSRGSIVGMVSKSGDDDYDTKDEVLIKQNAMDPEIELVPRKWSIKHNAISPEIEVALCKMDASTTGSVSEVDSQEQEETEGRDAFDETSFIIASPKRRALQGTRPKAISSTKSLRKQQKIDALKKALAMKALPSSRRPLRGHGPEGQGH